MTGLLLVIHEGWRRVFCDTGFWDFVCLALLGRPLMGESIRKGNPVM